MSPADAKHHTLKPPATVFKVTDAHSWYFQVSPDGSRLRYLRYRFNGKEARIGLGSWPDVSLADARQQRDGIRKLLFSRIRLTMFSVKYVR